MNFSDIEIAPFDNLLVYKKGYTAEIVAKIIDERKLGGLRIFSVLKDDRLETVEFLSEYSFLERLDITSPSSDFDFSFLRSLTNLKKLSLNVEGKNEIDLSDLANLEYLSIKWRKKVKGLEKCTRLLSLCLIEFKENDLMRISENQTLIDVRVKTASIENLNGIDKLSGLQKISIGNSKKLTSIKAMNGLPELQELYFDKCPKIQDYEQLTNLPKLETLSLIDCARVSSIKFIKGYPLLSRFSLLGDTIIDDGDLLPAKDVRFIEHKHYSHYNVRLENPSYRQNIKNNLQKIKNLFK